MRRWKIQSSPICRMKSEIFSWFCLWTTDNLLHRMRASLVIPLINRVHDFVCNAVSRYNFAWLSFTAVTNKFCFFFFWNGKLFANCIVFFPYTHSIFHSNSLNPSSHTFSHHCPAVSAHSCPGIQWYTVFVYVPQIYAPKL